MNSSSTNIDVESGTVDFLYSLSVLRHVALFSVFQSYINEAYRCLKRGGIGQIYVGRYSRLTIPRRIRHFVRGHKELQNEPVNHTNLMIRMGKAKNVARAAGFTVVGQGQWAGKAQDSAPDAQGRQSYITFVEK